MIDNENDILIRIIDEECNLKSFKCEKDIVNKFFYKKSIFNNKNLLSKVYIIENIRNKNIIGFFTLSIYRLNLEHGKKYGIQKIPAILLGRIGVDNNHRGLRLTETHIIPFTIGVCNDVKQNVGCRLLITEIEKGDQKGDQLKDYLLEIGMNEEKITRSHHILSVDLLI
ncbi:MAG: hypothetical protein ACTSRI_10160 [Promethearchaeota archaeon]